MENLDFSEEEIQEQLTALGYTNITKQRLCEFKRDLDLLIRHEKSKSSTSADWGSQKSLSSSCKSPPAFTKEKVQVPSVISKFQAEDQHRRVLTTRFDDNYETVNLVPGISYIKHSGALGCIRPSTASNRFEVEDVSSDIYDSGGSANEPVRPHQDLHSDTKPVLKRKVLRKRRGQSQVCDESTYSEDSEPVSELEQRFAELCMSAPYKPRELYSESEETGSFSDTYSSVTEKLPSAVQTKLQNENASRPLPKSFIRTVMDHPHRKLKKTDPVARYFEYKQYWDMFKTPEENIRRELRWAIREQLAYQPPPPKPLRTYIPNPYVVPTEKMRYALRWEIRHDLANGIIPAKVTY